MSEQFFDLRVGESLSINGKIRIVINGKRKNDRAIIGVDAPSNINILRGELHAETIQSTTAETGGK